MDLFTSITHQMDLWKCNKIIKLFVISSRIAFIKYLILLLFNIQKMPWFSNGICIRLVRKAYQKWYSWNKFRAVILIKFYRFDIRCTTQFIHKNYRLICYQSRTTNKKWMWILSEFKARDIVWCFFKILLCQNRYTQSAIALNQRNFCVIMFSWWWTLLKKSRIFSAIIHILYTIPNHSYSV